MTMTFKQAWRHMEQQGYRYGDSALNNVELGWNMAHGQYGVPPSVATDNERDANRWRRLVNASEMAFPIMTIVDDPENDKRILYGRQRLEELVDMMDEVPPLYPYQPAPGVVKSLMAPPPPPSPPPSLDLHDISVSTEPENSSGWFMSQRQKVTLQHVQTGIIVTITGERSAHAARSKGIKALEAAVFAVHPTYPRVPTLWCCETGRLEGQTICEACQKTSDAYQKAMGITPEEGQKRAIEAWTRVAQKAGISMIGGKKYLCLDEQMCMELGCAFEVLGWVHIEEG